MRRVIRHPDHFHPFAVPIDILLISTTVTARDPRCCAAGSSKRSKRSKRSKSIAGDRDPRSEGALVLWRCFRLHSVLLWPWSSHSSLQNHVWLVILSSVQGQSWSIHWSSLIISAHKPARSQTPWSCGSMETESFESSISRKTEKNSACYCLLNGAKIMPFSSWITLLW